MPGSGLFHRALFPGTTSLTKSGLSQIHPPPHQVAPSLIHRGLEHLQGWVWGFRPGWLLSHLWPPVFFHTGPLSISFNQISTRLRRGVSNWVRKPVFARVDGFIYRNNERWGGFLQRHILSLSFTSCIKSVCMRHRQPAHDAHMETFLWEIWGALNSCSHTEVQKDDVCECVCLHVEYGWNFRLPPGDEQWQNCGLRWTGLSLQHWFFFFFFNHQLSMMKYWGGIILIQLFFPTAIHYYL